MQRLELYMNITVVAKNDGNDDMELAALLLSWQMFLDSRVHGYYPSRNFDLEVLIYPSELSIFFSTQVLDWYYL